MPVIRFWADAGPAQDAGPMSRWLPVTPWREDLVGTVLSALGLGLIVYGILRSGTWGFVQPKAGAPQWLRLSPVIWLILCGGAVLRVFMWWESHRLRRGGAVLVDPAMLRNRTLRGGLISFLFQYLLQAGLFFAVPLFLSVSLGLSAVATGVRLLPLSITLLLAAAGIPKFFPDASPRRVVQIGFLLLFAGIVIMVALLDIGAGPEIVTWPMLLAGLGVGALASQLGSVPFTSDKDLKAALDKAGVSPKTTDAIVKENANARIDGLRSSLSLLAIIALIALFTSRRIPAQQPSASSGSESPA